MGKGLIFSKVGNELEEFVDSLKYVNTMTVTQIDYTQ